MPDKPGASLLSEEQIHQWSSSRNKQLALPSDSKQTSAGFSFFRFLRAVSSGPNIFFLPAAHVPLLPPSFTVVPQLLSEFQLSCCSFFCIFRPGASAILGFYDSDTLFQSCCTNLLLSIIKFCDEDHDKIGAHSYCSCIHNRNSRRKQIKLSGSSEWRGSFVFVSWADVTT